MVENELDEEQGGRRNPFAAFFGFLFGGGGEDAEPFIDEAFNFDHLLLDNGLSG